MDFVDSTGQSIDLTLYKIDRCGFCMKVMRHLEQLNMQVPMRDTIADPNAQQDLLQAGGKSQVPALSINGKILYESSDIIQYFDKEVRLGR